MALTFLAKVDRKKFDYNVPSDIANYDDLYYKTDDTVRNLYSVAGVFVNKTWTGSTNGVLTEMFVAGTGVFSSEFYPNNWDGTKPLPFDPTPNIGLDPLAGTSYKLLPQAEKAKYIALTEGKVVQEATRIVTMYKGLLVYMDYALGVGNKPDPNAKDKPPGGADLKKKGYIKYILIGVGVLVLGVATYFIVKKLTPKKI